jgi:hypothetical protein
MPALAANAGSVAQATPHGFLGYLWVSLGADSFGAKT